MGIGIIALLTGETEAIITISVFGAITLYILSMIALLRLRRSEPELERPFKAPLYPLMPVVALVIGVISLIAMCVYNIELAAIYFLIIGISFGLFKIFSRKTETDNV